MLFLAVFCGFLAEYQLEHKIEKDREKQYMQSMIEDLAQDTTEVNSTVDFLDTLLLPVLRKSINLLYAEKFTDSIIKELYAYVPRSTNFLTINFEDRTVSQLKSSGNLRLIRKKEVTDSLASYWKVCDDMSEVLLAGYDNARLIVKDLVFSLFDFNYYEGKIPYSALRTGVSFTLLSDNRSQFIKLANYISNLNSQAFWIIRARLLVAKQMATSLIGLIKDHYHFKV